MMAILITSRCLCHRMNFGVAHSHTQCDCFYTLFPFATRSRKNHYAKIQYNGILIKDKCNMRLNRCRLFLANSISSHSRCQDKVFTFDIW